MKEWLKMTQVGRLFEEEKLEYAKEKMIEAAKVLLEDNVDISTIMKSTGLSKAEIKKIEQSMQ